MQAVVWSDYLCPWCYLGRDRTALFERLGVSVTPLPYDLHPELPPVGRRVSRNGRLAEVLAYIGTECDTVGLPFNPPEHIPNTRLALRAAEVVRTQWPEAFPAVDRALFEAVFVTGEDIGDAAVLGQVLARTGVDAQAVTAALDAGEGIAELRASMEAAHEAGVSGTPAWLLDGRLLIPGVQDHESIAIWVERMSKPRTSG
ncbi:MAG TPA: DsbA family protein [Acidimicrobiales bacterium]|nr:DsbA family protein [Acidimicrobiales bacterium]